jgi:hypothetical protein
MCLHDALGVCEEHQGRCFFASVQAVTIDVDDLEQDASPEDLMLSYVSGEKSKARLANLQAHGALSLPQLLQQMCGCHMSSQTSADALDAGTLLTPAGYGCTYLDKLARSSHMTTAQQRQVSTGKLHQLPVSSCMGGCVLLAMAAPDPDPYGPAATT